MEHRLVLEAHALKGVLALQDSTPGHRLAGTNQIQGLVVNHDFAVTDKLLVRTEYLNGSTPSAALLGWRNEVHLPKGFFLILELLNALLCLRIRLVVKGAQVQSVEDNGWRPAVVTDRRIHLHIGSGNDVVPCDEVGLPPLRVVVRVNERAVRLSSTEEVRAGVNPVLVRVHDTEREHSTELKTTTQVPATIELGVHPVVGLTVGKLAGACHVFIAHVGAFAIKD
ncbi:unannotated protein [freshwater metagenome]|uniref:Unannotated protein n=1 Tax=freshwater metagenome TaxID=449393 RepID=A0A6J6I6E8_9ZZZZ